MKHILMAVVVVLLAAGCTTYKKNHRPDDVQTDNIFGEDVAVCDTVSAASIPWREFFYGSQASGIDRHCDGE